VAAHDGRQPGADQPGGKHRSGSPMDL
jgi:hypothetical protein